MTDEYYMKQAIEEAKMAFEIDEVPIGCVIVLNDRIIARSFNKVEKLKDPTAHAELMAITQACNLINSKYLNEATLYVTVEPCLMCIGSIVWARIGRVVYGIGEEKSGFSSYVNNLNNPNIKVDGGVLAEECRSLMQTFFSRKRQ